MTAEQLAELAIEALETDGGFTLDLEGHAPSEGYAVSCYPQAERIIENPTAEDVLDYLEEWGAVLADDRVHLGGWIHEGRTYLDLSLVLPDRLQALAIAVAHAQLAIYDLARGEEIKAAA